MNTPACRAAKLVGFAAFALLLTSCIAPTFQRASRDYIGEFANVANRQLLLNIAQVSNNEPAYFIQLGNFSAQYQYGGTLSPLGSGTAYTRNWGKAIESGTPRSALALAPAIGLSYMETPTFSFTPLTGDAVSKAVFSPLPQNIFSAVFSTYHADVALRTAVETISILPKGADKPGIVLKNDPSDPSYLLFLALAQEVRRAQAEGLLPVAFEPDASVDTKALDAARQSAVTVYNVSLSDAISALDKGYTLSAAPSSGKGDSAHAYTIYKKPSPPENTLGFKLPKASFAAEPGYPILNWIVEHEEQMKLSMRNFDLMIFRIGNEDRLFGAADFPRYAVNGRGLVPDDLAISIKWEAAGDSGPSARVSALVNGEREEFKVRPILRLTNYKSTNDLVSLRHRRFDKVVTYHVGDVSGEDNGPGITPSVANQVEFTLLSYLFAQSSIDSTKLPVQQIVQFR